VFYGCKKGVMLDARVKVEGNLVFSVIGNYINVCPLGGNGILGLAVGRE